MAVVEEWKCIKNYENYEISSMGRVRRSNKILKFDIANMYYRVDLYKNGSRIHKYVHRLVLEHYKINPNPSKFHLCDHINRNTFDNRICNLRWSNYQENSYNRQAKGYYYCRRENKFIATIKMQLEHLGCVVMPRGISSNKSNPMNPDSIKKILNQFIRLL